MVDSRSPEALGDWLVERLTSERAEAEWRTLLEAGWNALLDEPLSAVFPEAETEAFFRAHLEGDKKVVSVGTGFPGQHVKVAGGGMRGDRQEVGRLVPDEAGTEVLAVVQQKGIVHPAWVESIFREPAVE